MVFFKIKTNPADPVNFAIVSSLLCEYSMDFVNWEELIDLQIEDLVGLSIADQIAHILYELTFWGWDNIEIQTQAQKMLSDSLSS